LSLNTRQEVSEGRSAVAVVEGGDEDYWTAGSSGERLQP
jgi:hypothetical protein